jgi:hypothetical protein
MKKLSSALMVVHQPFHARTKSNLHALYAEHVGP